MGREGDLEKPFKCFDSASFHLSDSSLAFHEGRLEFDFKHGHALTGLKYYVVFWL